jgi:hypothetical protein
MWACAWVAAALLLVLVPLLLVLLRMLLDVHWTACMCLL